jgi:DNA/RNA endonuclease YhcR with UshA esterase domain
MYVAVNGPCWDVLHGGFVTRHARLLLPILALNVVLSSPLAAQKKLSASEAKDHIGETATVCGSVVSARYAASTKGQPTFLNLDKPYPNQVFTILIWGSNRNKFGTPEAEYKGKHLCATGKITEYRGVPQIVADEPEQIHVAPERTEERRFSQPASEYSLRALWG